MEVLRRLRLQKTDFSGDGTIISATKSGVTVSCVGNIPSAGYVTFTEGNTLTISSSSGNITTYRFYLFRSRLHRKYDRC